MEDLEEVADHGDGEVLILPKWVSVQDTVPS